MNIGLPIIKRWAFPIYSYTITGGNGDLKSHDNITVYNAPGERIQLQAYADALNKLTYGTWAITLDIDEYLDLGGLTVDEFLKPYNGVDSVKLNWVCYRG